MSRAALENIRIAFGALRANMVRSFLTMLGVVIGVFSIIALLGIGKGVKQDVTGQITELGSNLIVVLPGQVQTESGGFNPSASVGASTLTEKDLQQLKTVSGVVVATPLSLLAGLPTVDDRTAPSTLSLAVEPGYFDILSSADLVAGRLIAEDDLQARRRVMVLDAGPRKALFPDRDPEEILGQQVKFNGQSYEVIGMIASPESQSVFGGTGITNALFVPYTTAKDLVENTQIFRIALKADPNQDVKDVAATVEAAVKDLHGGVKDFTVFTQEDLLGIVDEILGILTTAIVGIGSISLVVGGIGIMNIMLVSVTERTKEIGLRKAVGASSGNILLQFLTEAITLSLLGGALGVAVAAAVSIPLRVQAGLTLVVDLNSVLTAVGFSVGVGVLFGVAPAVRASRLNPIEALRYE